MSRTPGDELTRVATASNDVEAKMIEALLGNHDIPCMIRHTASFSSMLPVPPDSEILVRATDYDRAKELVEAHFG